MPIMKVTLSVQLPDVGMQAILACAQIIQRPFKGFVEHLVKKQSRWLPRVPRKSANEAPFVVAEDDLELSIVIESLPGERLDRELEHQELQKTRALIDRAIKKTATAEKQRVAA